MGPYFCTRAGPSPTPKLWSRAWLHRRLCKAKQYVATCIYQIIDIIYMYSTIQYISTILHWVECCHLGIQFSSHSSPSNSQRVWTSSHAPDNPHGPRRHLPKALGHHCLENGELWNVATIDGYPGRLPNWARWPFHVKPFCGSTVVYCCIMKNPYQNRRRSHFKFWVVLIAMIRNHGESDWKIVAPSYTWSRKGWPLHHPNTSDLANKLHSDNANFTEIVPICFNRWTVWYNFLI